MGGIFIRRTNITPKTEAASSIRTKDRVDMAVYGSFAPGRCLGFVILELNHTSAATHVCIPIR